ncbi:unnamed protein product [Cladocopium goreaui]|uniref:Uncharacterized protein n=1 Tax=Cladocopium goreaui TaxID=2562237 RepID=A0A9P1BPZ5_9DINO|nr:unnamed protein product [Cladocopium goreaui]
MDWQEAGLVQVYEAIEVFAGVATLSRCLTFLAMYLVMAKQGVWVLEQPASSIVFRMKRFQQSFDNRSGCVAGVHAPNPEHILGVHVIPLEGVNDMWAAAKKRLEALKAKKVAASDSSTPVTPPPVRGVDKISEPTTKQVQKALPAADATEDEEKDLAAKKQAAMDASLRRICTPKPSSGKLEVSMEIYRQWKAGGAQRKCLLDTLVKAGGNKDVFKKQLEHLQKKSRRHTLNVEKGFYTKAAVAYCADKIRAKTHIRRDKYENHIREYWVDTATTGKFEDENEESFLDRTSGEGQATSFDMGLPAISQTCHSPGAEPEDSSDQELEEEEDGSSVKTRIPRKGEVEQEHALEAIENVSTVMANILKVQARLEISRDKLAEMNTTESLAISTCIRSHKKVTQFRDQLISLHDELADLKSYFDGQKNISKADDQSLI